MKTVLRACALLLLLCLCAAASAQDAVKKPAAGAAKKSAKAKTAAPPLPSIIWRGDHNTARAFMKDMAADYEKGKQGRVALTPFSTISGLDAVNDGTADIAGSSRPPMPDRAEEKGTNFYPVAWDALVMITSPKNPVSNVTLKQIHDIYLGQLTNWSDLGGPASEINLYAVAGPLDGNEYSLRDLIFHHGDQAVAVPRLYVNVEKLEEGIAIDPHGLGVTTFSAAHANPGLKMLTVEGITPSTASVADGSYPLYSTLFLASRDDSKNHEAITKFVQYTSSEPALAILRRHGLVPYTEGQNLTAKQAERVAYIDAHVYPGAVVAVAAATGSQTPVSAPVATADFLIRTAPNAPETQEAKDRAARINADRKQAADTPAGGGNDR
jgi:phosphate transport system substrate-binding protein